MIFKRKGSKFFQYTFDYKAKRYKGTTKKTNRRDALAWAAERRKQVIDESVGIFVREAPPTFKVFAKAFLEHAEVRHESKPKTLRFYQDKLKNLLAFAPLGNARLDHIDEEMVGRYQRYRMGKIAPSTCNRELATLSVVLSLAFERKLINRIPRIKKSPEGEGRTFILSRAHEPKLLAACNPLLADLLLLLLDTGLRVGEALNLTWSDIHLDPFGIARAGHVHVRGGKSRNAKRDIPLTSRAEALLRRMARESQSRWVFPGRSLHKPLQVTSVDHQFRKTCDAITTETGERLFPAEFVLHSLRHTCLTRLGEQGVGAFEIMKIAGHGSVVTSQRYVHPTPESAQRAIALLDSANNEGQKGEIAANSPHSLPHSWERAA